MGLHREFTGLLLYLHNEVYGANCDCFHYGVMESDD